ncbi:MAG: hypothetical protein Q8P13_00695 [bacterium]|nr:hypothetical protein [bacterium]
MTSVLSWLFGSKTKQAPAVQPQRPENPLLNRLRGITPGVQEVQKSQQSEVGKQRFLTELDEVKEIVEGLEGKMIEAANEGRDYIDVYRSNSRSPEGLRGLSRAVFDYLEREGFNPIIWETYDTLGSYNLIAVRW